MEQSKPTNKTSTIFLVIIIILLLISVSGSLVNGVITRIQIPESVTTWFNNLVNKVEPTPIVQKQVVKTVDEESATIDVVKTVSPSVVSVLEKSISFDFFTGPQTQESSIGTGFAVSENVIVTNKHVVSNSQATYTVVDNEGNKFTSTDIYRDPLNDLAIIKIEGGKFTPLELGDSSDIKVGQTAIAIGNALGKFSNTVTKGVISGIGRGITTGDSWGQYQEELDNVLQTDAALNPGNSGGPLLNILGQVIGINVAVGVGSENIGFAIPVNSLTSLLSDYNAGIDRRKPFLGIRYVVITADFAKNSDFPEGALVREVIVGSPAEKAKVKVNDVITKINNDAITEEASLATIIAKYKVGDKVTLSIWRSGKTQDITATLEPSPTE